MLTKHLYIVISFYSKENLWTYYCFYQRALKDKFKKVCSINSFGFTLENNELFLFI